ncbi:MAG: recombinase family protein [Lachnospiraceae bacterium]|nr:recombinase family protein [Lachnospiraceae bacterium]
MAKTVTKIMPSVNRYTAKPINKVKKRRVAGYARVSTDSDEQATSYEAQMEYYTNYIAARPDWEFAGMYSDEGISATNTTKRDGFKQMVKDAMRGKIDLILTKSVSRFARNTVDSLTTVRKLKDKGVEIYFEKENIWTLDAKGELLITIMSSLAQEESRSISENVKWGVRKRFSDGQVSVSFTRFLGYDRGENGEFVINEKQAVIVRYIYKRYLEGASTIMIAKELSQKGIKTVTGKDEWDPSTISSILTNEKYKGDALCQKCYIKDFLSHKPVKNNGEVPQYYVENHHEAIITPEQFALVQDEMKWRKGQKKYNANHTMGARIVCGACGENFGPKIWHSNDKYRRVVFQCNGKNFRKNKCQIPHLTVDQVTEYFIKAVDAVMADKDEIIKNTQTMMKMVCDTAKLEREQEALVAKLNDLIERMENAIAQNSRVAMDQEEYSKSYNGLAKQYETVKTRYDNVSEEIQRKKSKQISLKGFINDLRDNGHVVDEFDAGVFHTLFEKIVVYSKKDVRFIMKNGVELQVAE